MGLMHHDGRVCATLELRRATRLGPQRTKGMFSRLCGQKQWLSWSADLQMVHPEPPTTKNFAIILPSQSPAMVRQQSTLRSQSAARQLLGPGTSPSIRKALGQCYWPLVTQTNVSTFAG